MIFTAQIREPNLNNGRLISFEGLDGAGKTTQIDLLESWLKSHHIPYLRTREPGGTPIGEEIREIVLNRPGINRLTETYLFQADRAEHFATKVLPALRAGIHVITDRCYDASIAYQGYARGEDLKFIEELSLRSTQGYVPDLTILLDLKPSQVHKRVGMVSQLSLLDQDNFSEETLKQNGLLDEGPDQNDLREEQNPFDTKSEDFYRRARYGFRELARQYPKRIKVVDASRSPDIIHQDIITLVEPLLNADRNSARGAATRDG